MPGLLSKQIEKPFPAELFGRFSHEPGAIWLDSSLRLGDRGKTSILARKPAGSVTLCGETISNAFGNNHGHKKGIGDFLDLLSSIVQENDFLAIGFVSYEALLPFARIESRYLQSDIPSATFYLYDKALGFDHETNSYYAIHGQLEESIAEINDLPGQDNSYATKSSNELQLHTPKTEYLSKVNKIKSHIAEGDIYQANLTTRIDIISKTDPFDVYLRLRKLNPAPYSAFINAGAYNILSSSPERMFQKSSDYLTTGPIKGTIASGDSITEREKNRNKLLSSQKDRAELLMIVDLLRNDLGKIAQTGTVSVDRLFGTESYSSLIHLVADISCRLRANVTTRNIFEALTPGGSITGAPKKRAIEIIKELETVDRSVYTGCIGYICKERADFNIAIRTMIHRDNTFSIHAGGGIVADSDPHCEYEELMLKAGNLIKAVVNE